MMKQPAVLLVAFPLSAALLMAGAGFAEAGCIADTSVASANVVISPALDCLGIQVVGTTCVPGVEINFTNACDTEITLLRTSPDADPGEELKPLTIFPNEVMSASFGGITSGQEQVLVYSVQSGADTHTATVTFTAVEDETAYESCSISGRAVAPPLSVWGLLGVVGVAGWAFARRRAMLRIRPCG